jgi:hypothetical protein
MQLQKHYNFLLRKLDAYFGSGMHRQYFTPTGVFTLFFPRHFSIAKSLPLTV